MPSERIRQRIEQLLNEVDSAAAALDWTRVRALSDGILRLDPANEDARAFLEAATRDASLPASPGSSPRAAIAAPSQAAFSQSIPPTSFASGRYIVRRFLGEGGKKRVFLAHDTVLDRDVAFALIKAEGLDDSARARVLREAQVMGKLGDHPNIMPIHDLGREQDQPFMVLPLMPGGDVESLIQKAEGHRLPIGRAIEIALAVLAGLEFAHSRGIIHRDLKPGNVWLTQDGTPKIGDFGLALALEQSRLTHHGLMLGTAAYMSPEQALGNEITVKTDLYSFGCMLYEMVTGRPPFLGDDQVAIIGQHINASPVSPAWHNAQCPRPLEALIMRLLAKDPGQRPESAADVRTALSAVDLSIAPSPAVEEGQASGVDALRQGRGAGMSLDSLAGGVFVGRVKENGDLRAALDETISGHGRLVVIGGAPGIGKTRVALELATYAGLRHCQVLWGRCYEGSGAPPYWPWVQAIRTYIRERDPQQLRSEMGSGASVIAEVVSEVRQRLPDLQQAPQVDRPEAARFRLFDSLTAFFQGASRTQPIVLVLDDLQWADKPSLLLLEFIARELAGSRLLVVATYRDAGLSRQHPLVETLGELNRERLFQRVVLEGLNRDDVARFIEIASGLKPPVGLTDTVYRQTQGNPLFVTEIVRLLVQEGSLSQEGVRDRRSWTVRIPAGVREVVGRRLNRLSPQCTEMLVTAAAIGREFSLRQLSAVIENATEDALLPLVEEVLAARLVDEVQSAVGRYQFANEIVRETLLDELSATRRARLHARIAESLERLYEAQPEAPVAELAHHFEAAQQVLGPAKLIKYSIAAGERALKRLAYEEALGHYERAMAARQGDVPSPGDGSFAQVRIGVVTDLTMADVLSGLASAQVASRGREHLQESIDSLRKAFTYYISAGERGRAVAAVLRFPIPKVHATTGVADLLEETLALVEPDSPEAGKLYSRLGLFISFERGDYRQATAAFSRALEIAGRTHDVGLEIQTRANSAVVEWTHLRIEEAMKTSLHVIELASHTGDPQVQFESHEIASVALSVLGRSESAVTHASAALGFAEQLRSRLATTLAIAANIELAVFLGDWKRTRDLAERERQFGPLDQRILTPLLWAETQTGEEERAASLLRDLRERGAPLSTALVALAGRLRLVASPDDEIETLEAHGRTLLGRPGLEPFPYLVARVTLSLAAVHRGDELAAREYYAELNRLKLAAIPHVGFSRDRLMGLLAATFDRQDLARTHFEAALRFCRAARYLPELAWTCHDYAELLVAADGPAARDAATALIHEGSAVAAEFGMKPLLSKLATLWESVTKSHQSGLAETGNHIVADPYAKSVDQLTGLLDRRHLVALLSLDLELLRTRQVKVGLVRLDLDDFGAVNDSHGAAAGDALLKAVARTLRSTADATSTVARIGGDDFLVVLRFVDAQTALAHAAGLAKAVLNTYIQIGPERVRASCTAGVVMAPSDAATPEALIALSEAAIKSAKQAGTTSAHFYDPNATDRTTITALRDARLGILSALEEDRFVLVRMPIFRVRDRSIAHYEVLVRMKKPEGGLASPTEFIPQAETLDLIQRIDRRVIELTMERWRAYADAGQTLNLAINISGRSIGRELLDFIIEQADRWSVPHDHIILEVTETAVMRDERRAEVVISDMRTAGFKVAMDDFGSGATSLKRVRSLALDYLKLDGSLIKDLESSEANREFVVVLARLAHDAGLQIVAEFVSNDETMRFLEEQGIEYAQGWFLGKPEEFAAYPN